MNSNIFYFHYAALSIVVWVHAHKILKGIPTTTATKSYVLEPNYTRFSLIIFDGVKYECLRVPPNDRLYIYFNKSVFSKNWTRVKVTRNLVLRDTPCLTLYSVKKDGFIIQKNGHQGWNTLYSWNIYLAYSFWWYLWPWGFILWGKDHWGVAIYFYSNQSIHL